MRADYKDTLSNGLAVSVTWHPVRSKPGQKPTVYEALRTKLGREPSHAELCAEVKRILGRAD